MKRYEFLLQATVKFTVFRDVTFCNLVDNQTARRHSVRKNKIH